jgi:hypothetical protein
LEQDEEKEDRGDEEREKDCGVEERENRVDMVGDRLVDLWMGEIEEERQDK